MHHTGDVLIGTLRTGVSLSAQHLVPFASYLGQFTRDHPGIDLRLEYAPALMIIMVEEWESWIARSDSWSARSGRPDDPPGARAAAPRLPCRSPPGGAG